MIEVRKNKSFDTVVNLVESANYSLQSFTKLKGIVVSVQAGDGMKVYYDSDNGNVIYDSNGNPMYPVLIVDAQASTNAVTQYIPMNRYVKNFVFSTHFATGISQCNFIFDFADVL